MHIKERLKGRAWPIHRQHS